MGSLGWVHEYAVDHLATQNRPLSWQLFPSELGTILAAGFGEAKGVDRRLVFLGIDSSFCAVEKDFTDWACMQKKCIIQQNDWLGDLLPTLQQYIAKSWGEQAPKRAIGKEQSFRLSLLLWGTSFQVRVWQALLDIPYGHTVSYSALADRLGCSTAVRAVASAVAANPISLWVPCHRIVQKNGQIGKFHWGRALKQRLLFVEKLGISHDSLATETTAC